MQLALSIILPAVVALGLLNVWLVRATMPTAFRGGRARSLKDEFAAYGLPSWMFYVVGTLKIGAALALIAGTWVPGLVAPAAALIVVLMLGALAMHVRVRDPLVKSLPALMMLVMAGGTVLLS